MPSSTHLGGWYIGLNGGLSWVSTGQVGNEMSGSGANWRQFTYSDARHAIWGAETGYEFPVRKHFLLGLAGGYQYLGRAKQKIEGGTGKTPEHFNTDSLQAAYLLLTGRYYVGNRWSLFAGFGGALQRAHFVHTIDGAHSGSWLNGEGGSSETRYSVNPMVKAGVSANLSARLQAKLAYFHIQGQSTHMVAATNPSSGGLLAELDYLLSPQALIQQAGNHRGGWYLGVTGGHSWVDTGQAGNVYSDNDINPQHTNNFEYYDYRHWILGAESGYEFPVTHDLLLGVAGGYQYLGRAKQVIRDGEGNAEHFNTDSIQAEYLLLMGRYYVGDHLSLFAGFGGALQRTHLVHAITGPSNEGPWTGATNQSSETRYSVDPMLKAGVSADITSRLRAKLAYFRVEGQATHIVAVTNPSSAGLLAELDYLLSPQALIHCAKDHQGGWYLGITAGHSWVDTGQAGDFYSESGAGWFTFKYGDYQHTILGGETGYEFPVTHNLLLGVAGGYQYLGSAKEAVGGRTRAGTGTDTEHFNTDSIQAEYLLLTGRYYVGNRLSLFAGLGGALQRTRIVHTVDGTNGAWSEAGDHTTETRYALNPAIKAGMSLDLSQRIRAKLAYFRIAGQPSSYVAVANPSSAGVLAELDYLMTPQALSHCASAAHGGWYIEANGGMGWVDTGQAGNGYRSVDGGGAASVSYDYYDYRHFVWGADIGDEIAVLPRLLLGAQLGYADQGGSKQLLIDVQTPGDRESFNTRSIQGIDAMLTARFYVTQKLSLMGGFGGALMRVDRVHTVTGTGPVTRSGAGTWSAVDYSVAPTWRVAARYDVTSRFFAALSIRSSVRGKGNPLAFRTTVTRVRGPHGGEARASSTTASLGLTF